MYICVCAMSLAPSWITEQRDWLGYLLFLFDSGMHYFIEPYILQKNSNNTLEKVKHWNLIVHNLELCEGKIAFFYLTGLSTTIGIRNCDDFYLQTYILIMGCGGCAPVVMLSAHHSTNELLLNYRLKFLRHSFS